MIDEITKVCVRIPKGRTDELLQIAAQWREGNLPEKPRMPGWDRQAVHRIAKDKYGGTLKMFEHHGWPERGSAMPRKIMARVCEAYGNVESFVALHS